MRTLRWFPLLLAVRWAAASTDSDFQARLQGLNALGERVDQRLETLGIRRPQGFGLSDGRPESGEPPARPPLFTVHESSKALLLPQGRFLFGTLVHRLVVGSEGSPVLVELEAHQGSLSGVRLYGSAKAGSEGRLSIAFERILFPGGRAVPLQAVAMDRSGAVGLPAHVISQKALAVMGAMGASFVSGLAASQQDITANGFGFQVPRTGARNALLQGIAQTAADQSKRLIEEATAEKPVLIVEAGTSVTVLVEKEVRP